MNIQQQLPEMLTMQQACIALGMSKSMVDILVRQNKVEEKDGQITTASVGNFMINARGWDQEYTELYLYTSLQR